MKNEKMPKLTEKVTLLNLEETKQIKGGYRHGDSDDFIVSK